MDIEVRIEPGSLRKLLQASRTWDAVSRREMRRNLRGAASEAVVGVRESVLGPPPGGQRGKSTGLRSGLAGGVSVSLRSGRETGGTVKGEGVRVIASGRRLPPEQDAMVKAYMAREWRHPVFGRRDTYVSQRGKDWFNGPLIRDRERYQRAIVEAIETASRAITD